MFTRFRADQRGVTAIEYGLLADLIALRAIGALGGIVSIQVERNGGPFPVSGSAFTITSPTKGAFTNRAIAAADRVGPAFSFTVQ